jgi:hypothetical protein
MTNRPIKYQISKAGQTNKPKELYAPKLSYAGHENKQTLN